MLFFYYFVLFHSIPFHSIHSFTHSLTTTLSLHSLSIVVSQFTLQQFPLSVFNKQIQLETTQGSDIATNHRSDNCPRKCQFPHSSPCYTSPHSPILTSRQTTSPSRPLPADSPFLQQKSPISHDPMQRLPLARPSLSRPEGGRPER